MKYLKYGSIAILCMVSLSPAIVFICSVFWYIMTGTWLLVGVGIIQYLLGTIWCVLSVPVLDVLFGLGTMNEDC